MVVLYQAMPPGACDWLSTSVAWKSQSGRNAPGSVDASLSALMFSCCAVKYACSVISLGFDEAAGTVRPFGSTTAANDGPVASRAAKVKESPAKRQGSRAGRSTANSPAHG